MEVPLQPLKRYSIPTRTPVHEVVSNSIISHNEELEWEKSQDWENTPTELQEPEQPTTIKKGHPKKRRRQETEELRLEKTLNDKVFNLKPSVQRKLYLFNFVMNVVARLILIYLLVFLASERKLKYLQIFLSLEVTVVGLYVIVMMKMLFTKSDRESIYFTKIFNSAEWTDIEAQRMMHRHFRIGNLLPKLKAFFDPRTKFGKNIKISFLRQEIFKRMELVMVYLPFSVMFFFNQHDFVSDDRPNFKLYLTMGICLEVLRTTFTYLVVYVYS